MAEKVYTLKRIKECLVACEGLENPGDVIDEVRSVFAEVIKVTTNEGTITTRVDKALDRLKALNRVLNKEG